MHWLQNMDYNFTRRVSMEFPFENLKKKTILMAIFLATKATQRVLLLHGKIHAFYSIEVKNICNISLSDDVITSRLMT